jgi:hypothetical protein
MPTGRAIAYEHYGPEDLKSPVTLDPPEGAFRVYLHAEVGFIRYLHGPDEVKRLSKTVGFPLLPDYPDEFDSDLHTLSVIAGTQDSALSVYYYGT